MTVSIYHNPRCSKSRQTLALLRERDIEPEIIEYLQTPPDTATLQRLLQLLDLNARAIIRAKEAPYSELGLGDKKLSDQALLEAIVANPILLERPIVVSGDLAAIGRPPENVLGIL
jgi:arsenate reductase